MDAATAQKLAAVLAALRPQEGDADKPPQQSTAAAAGAPSGAGSGPQAAAELTPKEAAECQWWQDVGPAYSLLWDANKRNSLPKM
jgi:hypothetical protein